MRPMSKYSRQGKWQNTADEADDKVQWVRLTVEKDR